MAIKFALAGGGKARPPYFLVQPGKGPQGLRGFAQAVAYMVRRWAITGVISGRVTLVYPDSFPRDKQRRHAKAVVAWARPAIMREARRQMATLPARRVELWKGHEVMVPPFAVTARILLLADTCQKEFGQWWDKFLDHHWQEREEEGYKQDMALLKTSYRERWGDLPPKPEAEGPHFGTLEEHVLKGIKTLENEDISSGFRQKAEAIVKRRWVALKREVRPFAGPPEDMEAPDLYRCLYDGEYLAEQAAKILRLAGLDFPVQFTARAEGGIHPLWIILQGAYLEAQWGAFSARLGTSDKQVLMAARRFQRLRQEGLTFEEALEKSGCPLEAAQRLELGDYHLLDNEEDDVPQEEKDQQREALHATLEAWGLTIEEALALEGEAAKAFAASVRLAYEELQ